MKRLAILLALFLTTASIAQPPGGTPPPTKVTYSVVTPKDLPIEFDSIGVTEASKKVEIRARIEGYLDKRKFVEGSEVKVGDVLFEIDPRTYEADLEVERAQVDEAKTRLSLAESELNRVKDLKASGAISQSDIDRRTSEVNSARASVKLAEANMAKAELELSYTKVTAPMTGLIGKAMKEEGSFVEKGNNGLLTEVSVVDPIYANFRVSERLFLDFRKDVAEGKIRLPEGGVPAVELSLADGSRFKYPGKLSFEDIEIDITSGTMEIRGEFPNTEKTLKPGQFVRGRIVGWDRVGVVTIPQRAVMQSAGGSTVYVIAEGNKAEIRPVSLGGWSGKDWIVKDGLKAGEKVVVDGVTKIRPGAVIDPEPVAPEEVASAPAAAAPATTAK